jgi:tRNA(Glu) U13 pseudouridine synthase TruD
VRMNGVDNLKVNLFGWQRFMVEFHKSKIVWTVYLWKDVCLAATKMVHCVL